MRGIRATVALIACCAVLGCGGGARGSRYPRTFTVERSYQSGQDTVRFRVDKTAITVAESILVVVETDVRAGSTVRVAAPSPRGGETGFSVVDSGEDMPQPVRGGAVRSRRWFRMEPFLSGDYTVSPLSVQIADAGGASRTVQTDPVEVSVTSLLPADYERLDIKDIEPVIRPPWRLPAWAWIVIGILAAAGAGTGAWLWWRRRLMSRRAPPARPPHEIAYQELDALVADDLVAHGEIKLFYQRVTAILRRYIERRYGLRAPERTTEEFLWELRDTNLLTEELKKLLRAFLQHCDLVKFAEVKPLGNEIRSTLESCRDFVHATEPPPTPPEPDGRQGRQP